MPLQFSRFLKESSMVALLCTWLKVECKRVGEKLKYVGSNI
jgi:hypothetical protein